MPNSVKESPLSLVNIPPTVSSIQFSFQETCEAWDTGTSEPTSVLDLGSPGPSSRAVSSISGSLDDRATVSSSSLYDERERRVDGVAGYGGQEQGQHSRASARWMDNKGLEGKPGEGGCCKEEAVESLQNFSKTGDWLTRNIQTSNEEINYIGSGMPQFLRAEKASIDMVPSPMFAQSSQACIFPLAERCQTKSVGRASEGSRLDLEAYNYPKATFTGNILEEQSGEEYRFSGTEGFGSIAMLGGQGYIVPSDIMYGLSNRAEKNVEWKSQGMGNRGLDEFIKDLQGYSEFPVHNDPTEPVASSVENLDNMPCKLPAAAAAPDQSLMRWLLGENEQVQISKDECMTGVGFTEDAGHKYQAEFQARALESPTWLLSPLQTTKMPSAIPTLMSDSVRAPSPLQSPFPLLNHARAFPAIAQPSWAQKFTEPALSNFCHNSSSAASSYPSPTILSPENAAALASIGSGNLTDFPMGIAFPSTTRTQNLASKIFGSQMKSTASSGTPILISHNQMLSSSPTARSLNLPEPAHSQAAFISHNPSAAASSDLQIGPLTPILSKHLSFEHPNFPHISDTQPLMGSYILNSSHQFSDSKPLQPGSGRPESQTYYQFAGEHSQHEAAYASTEVENTFGQYMEPYLDSGASWQTKLQIGLIKEETLLGFKHFDLQSGASDRSPAGFSSSGRHVPQAFHHIAAHEANVIAEEESILVNHLLHLVEALDTGDPDVARSILARLNQCPLSLDKYIQRVMLYFREALTASSMSICHSSSQVLSPLVFFQKVMAHNKFCEASPYLSFAHFMANQAILEALEGEESVHVIDFGISFGDQWASFLHDFATRPGKTSSLRITSVGCRQDEMRFAGERLHNFAKEYNILFDFQMVVEKPENITFDMLRIRDKEPVAVNLVLGLHKFLRDSPSSIDSMLNVIRGISPKVVTVVEKEPDENSYYLPNRFLETLKYYSSLSDLLGAGNLDKETIMSIEKLLFMPEMMDVIATERPTKVEHCKGLHRWSQLFSSAGFYNIALSNLAEMSAECLIRRSSAFQGYEILKRDGSILLGWHGKTLLEASAWTC